MKTCNFWGANGLAEKGELSYSDLFQLSDDDDGIFAAVGLGWVSERRLIRVGTWLNTKPHRSLAGDATDKRNYGAYLVYGRMRAAHAVNFRFGVANDEVSNASAFTARFHYEF